MLRRDPGDEKPAGHCRDAVKIQIRELGGDHAEVAHGHYCAGLELRWTEAEDKEDDEDYEEDALILFELAHSTQKKLYGANHEETAKSAFAIGQSRLVLGEADRALESYEEALIARRAVLGEDHVDTAMTYYSFGVAHMNRKRPGDDALALSHMDAALARFQKLSEHDFANSVSSSIAQLCKRHKPACARGR